MDHETQPVISINPRDKRPTRTDPPANPHEKGWKHGSKHPPIRREHHTCPKKDRADPGISGQRRGPLPSLANIGQKTLTPLGSLGEELLSAISIKSHG
jgi:hypothetical protein